MFRREVSVAVVLAALCSGTCLAQNGDGSAGTEGAAESPMECFENRTIMVGDTFFSIAASLGITVADLEAANPDLGNTSDIKAGDVLQVPCDVMAAVEGAPNPSDCRATHVVQMGNTSFTIATCYDVTFEELMEVNPNFVDIENIFIGQRLLIPPCDGSSTGTSDLDCAVTPDDLDG